MNPTRLLAHFDRISEAPDAIRSSQAVTISGVPPATDTGNIYAPVVRGGFAQPAPGAPQAPTATDVRE